AVRQGRSNGAPAMIAAYRAAYEERSTGRSGRGAGAQSWRGGGCDVQSTESPVPGAKVKMPGPVVRVPLPQDRLVRHWGTRSFGLGMQDASERSSRPSRIGSSSKERRRRYTSIVFSGQCLAEFLFHRRIALVLRRGDLFRQPFAYESGSLE